MRDYYEELSRPNTFPPDFEFEFATISNRIIAFLIDQVILLLVIFLLRQIIGVIAMASSSESEYFRFLVGSWYLILFVLPGVRVLYGTLLQCSEKQATPGKMIVKIKLIDQYGRRLSFGVALARNLGKLLSGALLFAGYIMIAFTKHRQGLHDLIANTYVLKSEESEDYNHGY